MSFKADICQETEDGSKHIYTVYGHDIEYCFPGNDLFGRSYITLFLDKSGIQTFKTPGKEENKMSKVVIKDDNNHVLSVYKGTDLEIKEIKEKDKTTITIEMCTDPIKITLNNLEREVERRRKLDTFSIYANGIEYAINEIKKNCL